MKKILALLPMLIFFGCLAQQQAPQEKTLAQELGISPPPPYSAYYLANVSSPAGYFFGTLSTYYSQGNFRADVSFAGMPVYSLYSIGGVGYLCMREGTDGNCTRSEISGSSFGFALSQPASFFSVEGLGSRKALGMEARCFSISPKGAFSYFSSISCYSEKGILLHSFSQDLKSGTITESTATSIGAAPSEEKFRLPYRVK